MHRIDRELIALAVPALGALAADPLVSLVDTAFVGRLGVTSLAALGVNTAIFAFTFVIFNFLAYGTTPRIARALGRGDRAEAGAVAVHAVVLAVGVGVIAASTLVVLAPWLVRAMGAEPGLIDPAVTYLRIRAWAGPAVLILTASHGVFRGHHDTRFPMLVTLGLNAVNLVLDPVFIFGFGWGLAGAAWATLIAQWSGAGWFLWVMFRSRRAALGIVWHWPTWRALRPLLRVGGELMLRTGALIGVMTYAAAVATRVGTVAIAAHQVASQLWLLLALVVDALAIAAQAMVARYRGADEPVLARVAATRILGWGVVVGFGLAAGFLVVAPWLPGWFSRDPATMAAVSGVLPFVIWMQPLNAIVFVWDGVFMGAEAFRFLAWQMVLSAVAAAGVLSLVLPLGWGLAGVWWALVALIGVRAVTLGVRFASRWETR